MPRKTKGTPKGIAKWIAGRRFELEAEGAQFVLLATSFGEEQVIAVWPATMAKKGAEQWTQDVMAAARAEAEGLGELTHFRLIFDAGDQRPVGQYRIAVVPEDADPDQSPTTLSGIVAMLLKEREVMAREALQKDRLLSQTCTAIVGEYRQLAVDMVSRVTSLEGERKEVLEAERRLMEAEIAAGADLEDAAAKRAREDRLFSKGEKLLDLAMASGLTKSKDGAKGEPKKVKATVVKKPTPAPPAKKPDPRNLRPRLGDGDHSDEHLPPEPPAPEGRA